MFQKQLNLSSYHLAYGIPMISSETKAETRFQVKKKKEKEIAIELMKYLIFFPASGAQSGDELELIGYYMVLHWAKQSLVNVYGLS